jgi:hypothetical protein
MAIFGHVFRLALFLGFLALSMLVPVGLAQAQPHQMRTTHENAAPEAAMKQVGIRESEILQEAGLFNCHTFPCIDHLMEIG